MPVDAELTRSATSRLRVWQVSDAQRAALRTPPRNVIRASTRDRSSTQTVAGNRSASESPVGVTGSSGDEDDSDASGHKSRQESSSSGQSVGANGPGESSRNDLQKRQIPRIIVQTGRKPWSEIVSAAEKRLRPTSMNDFEKSDLLPRSHGDHQQFCSNPHLETPFANVAGAMLYLKGQHQPGQMYEALRSGICGSSEAAPSHPRQPGSDANADVVHDGGSRECEVPLPSTPDWEYRYYDDADLMSLVEEHFKYFYLGFADERDREPILQECAERDSLCRLELDKVLVRSGVSLSESQAHKKRETESSSGGYAAPDEDSTETSGRRIGAREIRLPILLLWSAVSANAAIVRADLFRYMALYIFGGVYMDQKGGVSYEAEYRPRGLEAGGPSVSIADGEGVTTPPKQYTTFVESGEQGRMYTRVVASGREGQLGDFVRRVLV